MTGPDGNPSQSISLDGGALDRLELIASGLLAPIDGYSLPGTTPEGWPFVLTLEVSSGVAIGDVLALTDPDGTELARVVVDSRATSDVTSVFVGGVIERRSSAEHPPARALRVTASDDWSGRVVAVFDGRPRPEDVVEAVRIAAGRDLVFLATTWNAAHADYSITGAVDDLVRCSRVLPGSTVRFIALSSDDPEVDASDMLAAILTGRGSPALLDFRRGDVASVRDDRSEGMVVLLSGLSGSGKSTIARAVAERLDASGRRSVLLDGDDVRRVLSAGLGFGAADRETNLQRIGWVAARIASVGGIALCAPIAPFASTRATMRAMAEDQGRFVLVYVATPLEVCEARDRKGLYARARAGEIVDFTGIDSPYEAPDDADLIVGARDENLDSIVDSVVALILRS